MQHFQIAYHWEIFCIGLLRPVHVENSFRTNCSRLKIVKHTGHVIHVAEIFYLIWHHFVIDLQPF